MKQPQTVHCSARQPHSVRCNACGHAMVIVFPEAWRRGADGWELKPGRVKFCIMCWTMHRGEVN